MYENGFKRVKGQHRLFQSHGYIMADVPQFINPGNTSSLHAMIHLCSTASSY